MIANTRHAVGDRDACKTTTTIEGAAIDACYTVADCNIRQAIATTEGITAYVCHTIRNRDAC